jgi:hypothetical protein
MHHPTKFCQQKKTQNQDEFIAITQIFGKSVPRKFRHRKTAARKDC